MALPSGFGDSFWVNLSEDWMGPGRGEVVKELEHGRKGELCSH